MNLFKDERRQTSARRPHHLRVKRDAVLATCVQMTEPIDLPPELQHVAELLSKQRPEVRDLFRYALMLAMIDDEKAHVIGTRKKNGQEWLTIKTLAGDVFEIIRPPISEKVEAELMRQVRAIIADEEGDGP